MRLLRYFSNFLLRKRVRNINLPYKQVDVFSRTPLKGNGLMVFYGAALKNKMQDLTREMKQYESIFVSCQAKNIIKARIFTMDEELKFAGHPVLGAAAALHDLNKNHPCVLQWNFKLRARSVAVTTQRRKHYYTATMEQGRPTWGNVLKPSAYKPILKALNLLPNDLFTGLLPAVVSAGFPYLIIPVQSGLSTVKVVQTNLNTLLAAQGAKETYVLDVNTLEGRNWNNTGTMEDIATAGAAGVTAAYLIRYGLLGYGKEVIIHQGRFLNRPSQMKVIAEGSEEENITSLKVSGDVCMVASGQLDFNLRP